MSEQQKTIEPKGKGTFENQYPGTKLEIELDVYDTESGKSATVMQDFYVFPAGIKQIQKFSKAMGRAVQSFAGLKIKRDPDGKPSLESLGLLLPLVVDIVLQDLLELVIDCVRGDVAKLSHWHFPPIVEAWMYENFGDSKKVRPWIGMIETTVQRITGEKISIWEPLQQLLSKQGIRDTISSLTGKKGPTASSSLTPGGQSPSGGAGQAQPPGSTASDAPTS